MAATPRPPASVVAAKRRSPRDPAAGTSSGRAAGSPTQSGPSSTVNPVCVECRKPFKFDCAEWVRVKPGVGSDFTLATEDRESLELLAYVHDSAPPPAAADAAYGGDPTVVFGTRATTPPARELEAGEWVKLTPEQCLAHLLMLGDATAEDLPLCTPCWAARLRAQQQKLGDIRQQTEDVVATIRSLDSAEMAMTLEHGVADTLTHGNGGSDSDTDADAAAEEAAIRAAEAELADLDRERQSLDAQMRGLEAREDAVAGAIQDRLAAQWLSGEDADRMAEKHARLQSEARRLSSVVAMEAMFPLDLDAAVPTLCGLRLGKLPSSQPTPQETNTACGLLLTAMSIVRRRHEDRVKCSSVRSLGLAGEASQIEVAGKGGKLERLDFHIKTSFFSWRTFGPAWVAFATLSEAVAKALRGKLEELDTASSAAAEATKKLLLDAKLPRVDGDKVGGFSVRFGDAPDHAWTSGVREVLRIVQWSFRADALVVYGPGCDLERGADLLQKAATPAAAAATQASAVDAAAAASFGEQ